MILFVNGFAPSQHVIEPGIKKARRAGSLGGVTDFPALAGK